MAGKRKTKKLNLRNPLKITAQLTERAAGTQLWVPSLAQYKVSMVVHACNPHTGVILSYILSYRPAWATMSREKYETIYSLKF